MVMSHSENKVSILKFHFLVARQDQGVEHFIDTHELGLFTEEEYLDAFQRHGIDAEFIRSEENDRGMIIGSIK